MGQAEKMDYVYGVHMTWDRISSQSVTVLEKIVVYHKKKHSK